MANLVIKAFFVLFDENIFPADFILIE